MTTRAFARFGGSTRCFAAAPLVPSVTTTEGGGDGGTGGTVRDGRRRRRSGGAGGGVPPEEARPAARGPRRERAHRRPVASALALAAAVYAGEIRRATGDAVPGAPKLVPHHQRDGRLPRGLREAVRAPRPDRCPCRQPGEGRGTVRRHCR